MKTIERRSGPVTVYTIQDVVTATGLTYSTVWSRIELGTWPRPTLVSGQRRRYYTEETFRRLVEGTK